MNKKIQDISPIITLIFLSPLIAELLSGSAPPLEFFNPISFIVLIGLYGCGVLLIREYSIKYNIGFFGIIILGIAYGIIEEGLAVKSFFDPEWMDLGILGVYGRWMGVNWVWSVFLTIYHTIYSIVIPIILFNLIFPKIKNKQLISDKGIKITILIILADIFFIYFFLTPYKPNPISYLITFILTLLIIISAFKLKITFFKINQKPTIKPIWFMLFGLVFSTLFFLSLYLIPQLVKYPIIPILFGLILSLIMIIFIKKYYGSEKNEIHQLSLTSGLLTFIIFLAFIHEINGMLGMSIVSICFIVFLIYIKRRMIKIKY
jgi:hypothetical protein